MQVVIFADRPNYKMFKKSKQVNPAMLPLAGKPVIQHIVESYQRTGAEKIWLVLNQDNQGIKKILNSGIRWSVNIEYVFCNQHSTYSEVLRRLGNRIEYPCIASRGDVVFKHWLDEPQEQLLENNVPASLIISEANSSTVNQLKWDFIVHRIDQYLDDARQHSANKAEHRFDFLDYYPLDKLADFHAIVLKATARIAKLPIQHGMKKHSRIYLGVHTRMDGRSLLDGTVFADDYSQIHSSAKIKGICYIGKGCIVDRNAQLDNSIVLDNTYIGPETLLKNALVVENKIYRVDLQAIMTIQDEALLSAVKPEKSFSFTAFFIALILVVLSFPIALAVATYIALIKKQPVFVTHTIRSKRITDAGLKQDSAEREKSNIESVSVPRIKVHLFNINRPALQKLPLLLLTLRGHLKLFGTSPFHRTTNSCWKELYDAIPIGAINLAVLSPHSGACKEEIELKAIEIDSNKWLLLADLWTFWVNVILPYKSVKQLVAGARQQRLKHSADGQK